MKFDLGLSKTTYLALVFASINCLSISYECFAQVDSRVGAVPTKKEAPVPYLQGTVKGEVKPFSLTHQNLRASVLTHPFPEPTLLFVLREKHELTLSVKLPVEAKKLLMECWKAEITFYYTRAFEPSGLNKRIDDRRTLGRLATTVLSGLQTITIDTPTGQRKISWDEAGDLVKFMAESARQVVEQAKESTKPKPREA